jgi:hypothetical protein
VTPWCGAIHLEYRRPWEDQAIGMFHAEVDISE